MAECIAVVNAGSSSVKFGFYDSEGDEPLLLRGQVEQIGVSPSLTASDDDGNDLAQRSWPPEGFGHAQAMGAILEVARELLALAGSFGAVGDLDQAARLFGAAEALLERSGAVVHPDDQPEHDRNIAFVRKRLGDEAFQVALAEGRQLTMEQAVASVYA